MHRKHGFSFIEVLISLSLVISISLALLKQQWQLSQSLQRIQSRFEQGLYSDNQQEQKGYSLIELCISLLLASCIMAGLLQHYVQIKQHYRFAQSTLENLNELQWVSDLLRMSIRKAGFTPCGSIKHLHVIDRRNEHRVLNGLDVGDHMLTIRRMGDEYTKVIMLPKHNLLFVSSRILFPVGQPIVLSDCHHAEVQLVINDYKTSTGQWLTLEKPLAFVYESPFYLGQWIEETFNIKNRSLIYTHHHTEELTPLIHSMDVNLHQDRVHLVLGLDKGRSVSLDTRMRMP